MAATAKNEKPVLAFCPFCPDGGKVYYHYVNADFDECGCENCGILMQGKNTPARWNVRAFASSADKAAAYNALVHAGALYLQFQETMRQAISKKKKEASQGAFIAAFVSFLMQHAGTVRSALNEAETDPLLHAPKPKTRKPRKNA